VTLHFLCTNDGVLLRFALRPPLPKEKTTCWPLPRLRLSEGVFDRYLYWTKDDAARSGTIAGLQPTPGYAGVPAWGGAGDVTPTFSRRHPAVVAQSSQLGLGLAVVLLPEGDRPLTLKSFLQRHSESSLYFYTGLGDTAAVGQECWGWLAPLPDEKPAELARQVETLVTDALRLKRNFRDVAPPVDPDWTRRLPDFPADLRHPQPVRDINDAIVYTINEPIHDAAGLAEAGKVGSDMLIRGWFKWHQSRDYQPLAPIVPQAHAQGALFGGGITCSALYDGENGLTSAEVLDMATRGPDGKLVDAWDQPGCRHGTLSNPAYRQYLLRWCKDQIAAGADYLFMDETNAALGPLEGFDDYSLADFRRWLRRRYIDGQGWKTDDARWKSELGIDLADKQIAPDGTLDSFNYRAYLAASGWTANPYAPKNPLGAAWRKARRDRDDAAWKWLCDAMRAYTQSLGRTVYISGNGLVRYVDLQVLGVWGGWRVRDGHIDLSENQLDHWTSLIAQGRALAGRPVPVVLFHDWGFGGFPWMEISPDDRKLWMRVRGAEIYAAGGRFAFPIRGPFDNNAAADSTLAEVARQTAFYQRNRDLYLRAELAGLEPLESDQPELSLALWQRRDPPALLLHVINRQTTAGQPTRRGDVAVRLPTDRLPHAVSVVSPDWDGPRSGKATLEAGQVTVHLPELTAYAVAVLDYDALPTLAMAGGRIVPAGEWAPEELEPIRVARGGVLSGVTALSSFLHGRLHAHLRQTPTFLVNMPQGGHLALHVRAVATQGARLEWTLDGQPVKNVELPDRDGKNDSSAREYDATFETSIPPGRHRISIANTGGDWAVVDWYRFLGQVDEYGDP